MEYSVYIINVKFSGQIALSKNESDILLFSSKIIAKHRRRMLFTEKQKHIYDKIS